jgi:hypothetical protein
MSTSTKTATTTNAWYPTAGAAPSRTVHQVSAEHTAPPLQVCVRKHRPWRNPRTGEIVNAGCGQLTCPACLPRRALECARALAFVRPERQMVLTGLAATRPEILKQVAHFRRTLRGELGEWRDAYQIEINPRETGYHAHMWVAAGIAITNPVAAIAARRARMGMVLPVADAPITTESAIPMLKYALKAVLPSDTGEASVEELDGVAIDDLSAGARRFLDINGGRLLAQTKGFWIHPDTGELLGGRRGAATAALRASRLASAA